STGFGTDEAHADIAVEMEAAALILSKPQQGVAGISALALVVDAAADIVGARCSLRIIAGQRRPAPAGGFGIAEIIIGVGGAILDQSGGREPISADRRHLATEEVIVVEEIRLRRQQSVLMRRVEAGLVQSDRRTAAPILRRQQRPIV